MTREPRQAGTLPEQAGRREQVTVVSDSSGRGSLQRPELASPNSDDERAVCQRRIPVDRCRTQVHHRRD
ncbi:hypothetical protein K466DRAFT_585806 [Polyporus arcularius HHB13444]|uniref:Uncharacterized protein n=1 Tax=Polyporus arcularius HHB13444 TaxID=1314778 RepID=A0A5C3PFT9_9APHY|nr:hypothetical protein K466DRAFT_585806 [Polyporus arcularius HHB13444]